MAGAGLCPCLVGTEFSHSGQCSTPLDSSTVQFKTPSPSSRHFAKKPWGLSIYKSKKTATNPLRRLKKNTRATKTLHQGQTAGDLIGKVIGKTRAGGGVELFRVFDQNTV